MFWFLVLPKFLRKTLHHIVVGLSSMMIDERQREAPDYISSDLPTCPHPSCMDSWAPDNGKPLNEANEDQISC